MINWQIKYKLNSISNYITEKGPNYWGVLAILRLTKGESIEFTGEQFLVVTMLKNALKQAIYFLKL